MTSETLFWLSGFSLTFGGLFATLGWILFTILDPEHQGYEGKLWLPRNYLIIAGRLFMALGLPGFYVRQAPQSGV